MASVLIITNKGKGTSLALRLANEGHIVKMYSDGYIEEGFLKGMKNPSTIASLKLLDQFDLVLDDGTGNPTVGYDLQEKGKTVIGGGPFPSKLEDSVYLSKVKTALGLPSVDGPSEGIKVLTYGWFNKQSFSYVSHSLVASKFLDGNRGPKTECSGAVTFRGESDRLTTIALSPFEELLTKVDYTGPFGVEVVLNNDSFLYDNVYAKFVYDVFPTSFELVKGNLFDFLWKFFLNEEISHMSNEYALSARLSCPPYPYKWGEKIDCSPFVEIPIPARNHVWLDGHDGIIGCITARGTTINEARRRVYRTIKNIVQSDVVQYRQDIGQNMDEQVKQLKDWGWLE